jgi:cyclic beta-1,2-glucan synthetase
MYRTAVEGILGIHLQGKTLRVDPCIPRTWTGFEATYTQGSARYHIKVTNPKGVNRGIVRVSLDGREAAGTSCEIALEDDGREHSAEITLG